MQDKKDKYQDLVYNKVNYYEVASQEEKKKIFDFAEGYKAFIDECKTERECSSFAIAEAKEKGFKEYHFGDKLKKGDKRYFVNRDKGVTFFKIGSRPLESEGLRIVVAHIDAPRLDIKQIPVYESDGFCYLKTHYYGGIKKYQWMSIPLAMYGVIYNKDGEKIKISILLTICIHSYHNWRVKNDFPGVGAIFAHPNFGWGYFFSATTNHRFKTSTSFCQSTFNSSNHSWILSHQAGKSGDCIC